MLLSALLACSRQPPLTDADRATALTVAAVAPFATLAGTVDPARESWSLDKTPEGRWTLDYAYSDGRLLVEWSAARASDARWVYLGYGIGKTFMDGADRVEVVDAPGILAWGEECECSYVRTAGRDVGFACRGLHGDKTFLATVVGILPVGEAAPGRLLAAPLAALDAWDPAASH